MTFGGCFGPPSCCFFFYKRPETLPKKSYSKCFRRTQIRWVIWPPSRNLTSRPPPRTQRKSNISCCPSLGAFHSIGSGHLGGWAWFFGFVAIWESWIRNGKQLKQWQSFWAGYPADVRADIWAAVLAPKLSPHRSERRKIKLKHKVFGRDIPRTSGRISRRTSFRQEKRAQILTFWVRRPPGGVGGFHSKGWWPKTSWPPSKVCLPCVSTRGIWDVPGILPGCPGLRGVFKKFVQKNFVRTFRSLVLEQKLSSHRSERRKIKFFVRTSLTRRHATSVTQGVLRKKLCAGKLWADFSFSTERKCTGCEAALPQNPRNFQSFDLHDSGKKNSEKSSRP